VAYTNFGAGSVHSVTQWSKIADKVVPHSTPLLKKGSGFCGDSARYAIHKESVLGKEAGDTVNTTLYHQIEGEGRSGNQQLRGHAVERKFAQHSVTLDVLRHAVANNLRMSPQRVAFDYMKKDVQMLTDWAAARKETWAMSHLCGWNVAPVAQYRDSNGNQIDGTKGIYTGFNSVQDYDAQHIVRAGNQANDGALTSSDIFTLELIDEAVERAQNLPVPIRPLRISGNEMYVIFVHPRQITDLRTTSGSRYENMVYNAAQGGQIADNPLVTGDTLVYNNTLLVPQRYSSPGVHSSAGVANTRRAAFVGAGALRMVYGKQLKNDYEITTMSDDHNQYGETGITCVAGMNRVRYSERDSSTVREYGSIIIPTYAADLDNVYNAA